MTRRVHRKSEAVRLRNEHDFPYLVELALPPGGFGSIFLEIDAFHREQRIPVRRGRSRHEVDARGCHDGVRQVMATGVKRGNSGSWKGYSCGPPCLLT